MYHNYFFLKRLAADLEHLLIGKDLIECFSQNKDELILGFADNQSGCYIKATLESSISLLHISDDFKRAKKNSVNLFEMCLGHEVIKVSCYQYERSFWIRFDDDSLLIFKMHGSRSNVLYAVNDMVQEIFRNNLPADLDLIPSTLNKPELSRDLFVKENGNPQKTLPALGKEVGRYLEESGYEDLSIDDKWTFFKETLQSLSANPCTIEYQNDVKPEFSLLQAKQDSERFWQTQNAIEASSRFYQDYTRHIYLNTGKHNILKDLNKKIKQSENYLSKTKEKLQEVQNQRSHEEIANIIMANLHLFQKGASSLVLDDFYTGGKLEISLKPNVTPQKHAEQLYRKSKNRKIEIQKLEENLNAKQQELEKLEVQKTEINSIEDFKELRVHTHDHFKDKTDTQTHLPYYQYQIENYPILVGKNAKANDELTTRYAHKNDLWLHAKDVPGSHVIIKVNQSGTVPSTVIEYAAELAAWFSKRKTDTLCPVICTEKKYVRKIKGAPAGAVKVDHEKVIMVKPTNHPN